MNVEEITVSHNGSRRRSTEQLEKVNEEAGESRRKEVSEC